MMSRDPIPEYETVVEVELALREELEGYLDAMAKLFVYPAITTALLAAYKVGLKHGATAATRTEEATNQKPSEAHEVAEEAP